MPGCSQPGLAAAATTYLVESQHAAETCPAQTEEGIQMMADLVLGTEHASRSGVSILDHNVVLGKHRLLIVLEAPDIASAERYAEPFKFVGPVTISAIGTCEAVMAEAVRELQTAKAGA